MTFFIYFCFMIVELLCRFSIEHNENDLNDLLQELETEAIIKGGDFDLQKEKDKLLKNKISFDYAPMILNLKDIFTFNSVDNIHTCLRFHNGTNFTYKIKYDSFKVLYQTLTGKLISDFAIEFDKKEENKNG